MRDLICAAVGALLAALFVADYKGTAVLLFIAVVMLINTPPKKG